MKSIETMKLQNALWNCLVNARQAVVKADKELDASISASDEANCVWTEKHQELYMVYAEAVKAKRYYEQQWKEFHQIF